MIRLIYYKFEILENGKVIEEMWVQPKDNTQLGAERVAKKYVGSNQTLRQKA